MIFHITRSNHVSSLLASATPSRPHIPRNLASSSITSPPALRTSLSPHYSFYFRNSVERQILTKPVHKSRSHDPRPTSTYPDPESMSINNSHRPSLAFLIPFPVSLVRSPRMLITLRVLYAYRLFAASVA